MLEALASALRSAGLAASADDLRDILWLAQVRGVVPAGPDVVVGGPPLAAADGDAGAAAQPRALPPPPPPALAMPQPPARGEPALYASAQRGSIAAGVLRVPGVAATPAPAALRRALQPLARRVPSGTRWQLDEEATATHKADTGLWCLLRQPLREHWFDLNLVVERSASMALWQPEVEAFVRGLKGQGGFRSLRRYVLAGPGPGLLHTHDGLRTLPLAALHTPGRRTLTLLLTDTGAEPWRSGAAQRWLFAAGRAMPVSVLQLLPQRTWRHTPLGEPDTAAWARRAGQANSLLQATANDDAFEHDDAERCLVPMLGLDPVSIRRWASATAARVAATVPCAVVTRQAGPLPRPTAAPDALQRVADYRRKVSHAAYDLAVFLTVPDPLTVPVMRLVQRTMLPDTGTAELAEFFLGGLLVPLADDGAAAGGGAVYRYADGVRDALMRGLRYSEQGAVAEQLARVGRVLAQAQDAGAAGSFDAYFPRPGGSARLSEWALPFATTSRAILQALEAAAPSATTAATATPATSAAPQPRRPAACMALSPDGLTVVTGTPAGTLKLWRSADGRPTGAEIGAQRSAVVALAWSSDGNTIASAGADGEVNLWEARRPQHDGRPLQGGADLLDITPAGDVIAGAHRAGMVALWDRATGALVGSFDTGMALHALRWCAGGRRLATAHDDGSIQVRDVAMPAGPPTRLHGHAGAVRTLAGDGAQRLVSGGDDGALQLWSLDTGVLLATRSGAHAAAVRSLGWGGDGRSMLSLGEDGVVCSWDAGTLAPTAPPLAVGAAIGAALRAPDGALLLCAEDGQLTRQAGGSTAAPPAGGFYDSAGLLQHVQDSGRLADGDDVRDSLLIFATPRQQTWVVFTHRALVLVLDDEKTRADLRLVQRLVPLAQALPVDAQVDAAGVATVAFGSASGRWYYSAALFASPGVLAQAVTQRVRSALGAARGASPVPAALKAALATITRPDGVQGAGCLVAPRRIGTAASLVHDWGGDWHHVALGSGSTRRSCRARLLRTDQASGAALLEVEGADDLAPMRPGPAPAPGSRWLALGFSRLPLNPMVVEGSVGRSADPAGRLLLQVGDAPAPDLASLGGFAGAPVVAAGQLIGLLLSVDFPTSPQARIDACPISAVLALLETPAPEPATPTSGPVFISRARREDRWALAIANRLEQTGFSVILDNKSIEPGEPWQSQLHESLRRCRAAVLLVSQAWLASTLCQAEADVLQQRLLDDASFRLVPLRLDGAALPAWLQTRAVLDFSSHEAPQALPFERLVQALRQTGHADAMPASPWFDDGRPQLVAIGAMFAEFGAGLDGATRRGIGESLLIAQLAADAAASAGTTVMDWYGSYTKTLQGIGWAGRDLSFHREELPAGAGGLRNKVLQMLTTMLGPGLVAGSPVAQLLQGLDGPEVDSPDMALFHRASEHVRGAKFQFASITAGTGGDPELRLLCFGVDARSTVQRVLFFMRRNNQAQIACADGRFSIARAHLDSVREAVAKRVAPFVADHIRHIQPTPPAA